MNKLERMRELIGLVKKYDLSYEEGHPEISDIEYDKLYLELRRLEKETGAIYPDSVTQHIHYEVKSALEKVIHNHPMLSLDKTKDVEELRSFISGNEVISTLKMDGLTCSLLYQDGKLVRAETRGDGEIGEDITHNARVIQNLPQEINYDKEVVIDGEIICCYDDFEKLKDKYDFSNPRNMAAGSIRLLDSKESERRKLTFVCWDVITDIAETLSSKLKYAEQMGFEVVPYLMSTTETIEKDIEALEHTAATHEYPIDGIVLKVNNVAEYKKAGLTGHHPKAAIAFKFMDETVETELLDIQWQLGRTNVLTPVAIVKEVELEGSKVSKASLHNLSIYESIMGKPYKRQKVRLYKANMIIPQILSADKKEENEDFIPLPKVCPICGHPLVVQTSESGTKNLICEDSNCEGKLGKRLEYYCGKKALDIKGLSAKTIEKLLDWGFIDSIVDIYKLQEHKKEWVSKPGFGEKSVTKILDAIEESKKFNLQKFICACGIAEIGTSASKDLAKYFGTWKKFRSAVDNNFNFERNLPNFGFVMSLNLNSFDYSEFDFIYDNYMCDEIVEEKNSVSENEKAEEKIATLEGKTFVITGKLSKSRNAISTDIENAGGKVTGSISSKTDYLVIDNPDSTTSKAKKAKDLGIPLISEVELYKMIGE